MPAAKCPSCGNNVTIPRGVGEDELVDCEKCGAELTVKSVNPPAVALFREEEK